jgi:hypothetical protein
MLESQHGKCGACGDSIGGLPSKHIHVDHDHVTGAVRAVLCRWCNVAIGSLRDSPTRALKIVAYLRKHAPSLPFKAGAA